MITLELAQNVMVNELIPLEKRQEISYMYANNLLSFGQTMMTAQNETLSDSKNESFMSTSDEIQDEWMDAPVEGDMLELMLC